MFISTRSYGRSVSGLVLAVAMWLALPVTATMPDLSFSQIVAGADLVFVGTVVSQDCRYGDHPRVIFTDVTFALEEVIHRRPSSQALNGDTVVLSFAGGRIGEYMVEVSDVPRFVTGEHYVVFTKLDGRRYASPVIGGFQGVFPVVDDRAKAGVSYPLAAGGRYLTGVEDEHLTYGMRTERITNGEPAKAVAVHPDLQLKVAPRPSGISALQGARAGTGPIVSTTHRPSDAPLTLRGFVDLIHQHLARVEGTAGASER